VREIPFLVIEERVETVARIREEGVEAISGTAGQRGILEAVNLPEAQWLISAIPSPFEATELIERARKANPEIRIVVRAHNDAEVEHLRKVGADYIVLGEREIAREMVSHVFGLSSSADRLDGTVDDAFRRAQVEIDEEAEAGRAPGEQ
jgi:CPA2 family monovalent cation:H+ antiporter-2